MFIRSLSIVALLIMIPMAAFAGTVSSRVMTTGGSITINGGTAQTSASGTVSKSYSTAVPVVMTPAAGYVVSGVTLNGVAQPLVSPLTVPLSATAQTVTVSFARQAVTVTSSATTTDGTVSPYGTYNTYTGTVLTYTFTPNTGKSVVSINGLPGGAVLKDVNGNVVTLPFTGTVKATFTVAGNTSIVGAFTAISANAGAAQTILLGSTATLSGSATVTSGTTYAWTQVSGPTTATITNATATNPTVTVPVAGVYTFKLTATNGSAVATATTTVTVSASASIAAKNQCVNCHTGAGVGAGVYANWSSSSHAAKTVMCYTCHVGANTGSHPGVYQTSCVTCHSNNNDIPAEMTHQAAVDTDCKSCHTTGNDIHTANILTANAYTIEHVGGKGAPASGAVNAGDSVSQLLTQNATCTDCHNSTNANLQGYAAGAHGQVSNDPMNPFTHYDWAGKTNDGTRQNASCDRCHTTSGFLKLLNGGQDDSRIKLTVGKPGGVLLCVTCHTSIETGALRTGATPNGSAAGALTNGYFALFSSSSASVTAGNTKIQIQFPGLKNSSICVPCHSGRSTDQVFVQTIAKSLQGLKNYSTISTSYYQHGKNIAQTFIGKGGYDFSGQLATVGISAHSAVQMSSDDTQGPCVGCHHTTSGQSHSLAVDPTSGTCAKCHATTPDIDGAQAKFNAGIAVLNALAHQQMDPLRTTSADLATERANVRFGRLFRHGGETPAQIADLATKGYGAWYNWQILVTYDNAAFAHNPAYARQLLNDTIDYLDDGVLNNSAAATIAALGNAGTITAQQAADADAFRTASGALGCIDCHSVGQNAGSAYVNDNNGVRAITSTDDTKNEFKRNSHHVYGKTLTNADCAVCHLEGKVVNGVASVNGDFHMKSNVIYLRDGGGADFTADGKAATIVSGKSAFVWDPANPNHKAMDQFCMSCHNANGAPNAVGLVTGNSATNPFGDAIANGYDQMSRSTVVAVFEQFNTSNVAHHAVRGQRYSTRTSPAAGSRANTVWTNYSGAAGGVNANGKPTYPGSRKTLYEAGLFVSTYNPLGASQSVGDDSTLHCGDCHTVGQYKQGSTTNAAGQSNTVVIGAHGSANEYLLRNSLGTDAKHHQDTYAGTDGAAQSYVCYLCHKATGSVSTQDGTGTYNSVGGHGGIPSGDCNALSREAVGKVGSARVSGTISSSPSNSTLFGYTCANCHSSGNKVFGGIHGATGTFRGYSTNGTDASAGNPNFTIVNKKPYRFMGGTSLKYTGGGSDDKWEARTLSTTHREGCYNLSTDTTGTKQWSKTSPSTATDAAGNPVSDDLSSDQNNGGVAVGSWGACGHHVGSTTTGANKTPTRKVQRPLQY